MWVDMKTQHEIEAGYEQVSALMDGCLSGVEFDSAVQFASGEGQEHWHLYHVIGDTLRSSELAACGNDARFLETLRERLGREPDERGALPTVAGTATLLNQGMVPERAAANDGIFRWKLVAGLASFAAVAAIGWGALGGGGATAGLGPQMAQNTAPASSGIVQPEIRTVAAVPAAGESDTQVILRDPLLDELLAAHRQASGASALGDTSGFLRNATFEGSGR